MTDPAQPVLDDPVLVQAIDLLPEWLPDQRWFAGVHPPPARDIRVVAATRVRDADPPAWHLLVEVSHNENRELYQVALSVHEEPEPRLEHVQLALQPLVSADEARRDADLQAIRSSGLIVD